MYKVGLLVVFSLALLISQTSADTNACCGGDQNCTQVVCQPCNNYTTCPECFPNGPNASRVDSTVPCCKQFSQIIALTAASVSASTYAFAAAHAASFAATKVFVSATTGASVGSFVSIVQTLSLSINTGKCCEISQEVQANATAYAKSFATAAVEANAAAAAAALAVSAAEASSEAAASMYAKAESFIKSTCCGFDLDTYSAVLSSGNYAVKANASVIAAKKVVTSAQDIAKITSSAASDSEGYTKSWAQAKIDNCCNNNFTQSVAANVAGGCLKVMDKVKELHGYLEEAIDFIASYAKDEDAIDTPLNLIDDVCIGECKDVLLSCCENPCAGANDDTFCLASKSIAEVYLGAKATAVASAEAAVYSKSVAKVYAETITAAFTAVKAASGAAATIQVNVQSCCSVIVSIDTAAFSNAKAIGVSFAKAQAAAQAYSYGYSAAKAVSQAIATATAAAKAIVIAYYNACCGTEQCKQSLYLGTDGNLKCCDYTKAVVEAYSNSWTNLVSTASANAESLSESQSEAATSAKSTDCTNIMRKATSKSAFMLQCCCCTTKNKVASTVHFGAVISKPIYFFKF